MTGVRDADPTTDHHQERVEGASDGGVEGDHEGDFSWSQCRVREIEWQEIERDNDTDPETGNFQLVRLGNDIADTSLQLDNGADVNTRDENEATALHFAMSGAMARPLTKEGASVHACDVLGRTPLFRAVHLGRTDVVEELISSGADVRAIDVFDQTVMFQINVFSDSVATLQVLVDHGAFVQISPEYMDTPLHNEAMYGELNTVQFLRDHGASMDASMEYQTPLYEAAVNGHFDIVKPLLERGASVYGDPALPNFPALATALYGKLSITVELFARGVWLRTDQPILTRTTQTGLVPSDVEVLDLLVQHIEAAVPEHPPTAGFAFNKRVWVLMRGIDKVAPKLKAQWTPVVRKLVAFVTGLNSGKDTSSNDTWARCVTVLFRLWEWMLQCASRKAEQGSMSLEGGADPQALETLTNLRKAVTAGVSVPQVLATTSNADTVKTNTDPSVLLETAVGSEVAALKTFVVDEIQRGVQERAGTQSQPQLGPVWAKLHNTALGLVAPHEQHVVHGELASSRSITRGAAREVGATCSTSLTMKDANAPVVHTADSLAVHWSSPESL